MVFEIGKRGDVLGKNVCEHHDDIFSIGARCSQTVFIGVSENGEGLIEHLFPV